MRRFALLGAFAVLLVASPVAAQEEEPPMLRIDSVDQSDYPTVVLTVTVPPEMNGLELGSGDFFVAENEVNRPVDVTQLPAEELRVALLMDTSGSMRGAPINAAKSAVEGFVAAMPPDVELALIEFGDTADLAVPFTTEQDEILSGLSDLEPNGETALYDALVAAVGSFEGNPGTRRTIVLLTDGGDTNSEADLQTALVALIGSDATVLIVELESPESDRTTLTRLEAATGGILVAATDPEALEGIYAGAASDLVNQYELTYTSDGGGPTELVVAARGGDLNAQGAVAVRYPAPAPPEVVTTVTTAAPTTTTAPPAVVAAPISIEVPWFATTTGLMLGAAAVFAATTLVLLLLLPSRRKALEVLGGFSVRTPSRGRLSELTNKATLFAEDTLNRGESGGSLRLLLDQAGLRIRDGEFLLLVFAVLLVAVVGGFLFAGILVAVAFGLAVILGAFGLVRYLGTRRATKFRMQLPDSLQLISGSLRAGFGLNQAITAVAGEQDAPANEEFARAQLEVHLGRDVEDALRNMAVRVQSEDLPWVAEAIEIHREIGGDVADLLDQIANTVRERERIRGQIQVLSAEGKVSGIVLVALPFIIAGVTNTVAPEYLGELTRTTTGQLMLLGGVVFMIVGIFWIRRIVRLEF